MAVLGSLRPVVDFEALKAATEAASREVEDRAAKSTEERWAGELLKTLLGARRWLARDIPGGPSGMHDLDLLFDDERRFAVEVKSHTSPERAAFKAELRKINPISAPSLNTGWEVNIGVPDDNTNDGEVSPPLLKETVPQLPGLLERVETENLHDRVRYMSSARDQIAPQGGEVASQLQSLGVTHAYPASWREPGTIYLRRTERATWPGSSDIVATAEEHIGQQYASARRAIEDGAHEVHLFIWLPLGVTRSDAASAAASDFEPELDWPRMPANMGGLDSVWVARLAVPAAYPELHGFSSPIWQFTKSGPYCWRLGWQRQGRGRPS